MTKVDFFGHWFYFFLFVGMLLLQAKDYRGWAFRFAGELGWIGIGFVMGMSSIWLWGFAFLAVDVLGYFKWQKEQHELADLEREQAEWTASANEYLNEVFPEDPGYEYVKRQAQQAKTEESIIAQGAIAGRRVWSLPGDPIVYEPEKVKKNVKRKAKRNSTPKRKGQGKKVATKRSRPANRKVQPRRGRSSK